MDNSYMYQYIDWSNIKTIEGKSESDTFELLCADFMKIKYGLSKSPSIGGKTYKGTEGPPIKGPDGLLYGFQSKFTEDSFTEDCLYDSCENIWDGTEFLCIFTKDSFPSDKTNSKKYIPGKYPSKNATAWNNYFKDLQSRKKISKIELYTGNDFINELKQDHFFELWNIYFNINMGEIYKKCEDPNSIPKSILNKDLANIERGFEGNRNLYKQDLVRAELIQKQYSCKKLSYSTIPWILKKFDTLEKEISDEIFDELAVFGDFSSMNQYIDSGIHLLEDTNSLRKHSVELETLIHSKRGLFVNYGTQGLSSLNYIGRSKIEFKDKRYGGGI